MLRDCLYYDLDGKGEECSLSLQEVLALPAGTPLVGAWRSSRPECGGNTHFLRFIKGVGEHHVNKRDDEAASAAARAVTIANEWCIIELRAQQQDELHLYLLCSPFLVERTSRAFTLLRASDFKPVARSTTHGLRLLPLTAELRQTLGGVVRVIVSTDILSPASSPSSSSVQPSSSSYSSSSSSSIAISSSVSVSSSVVPN